MESNTDFGDVTMDVYGTAQQIYGRVGQAVSLRAGSYITSHTPFYTECFSNPARCFDGFTISFWLFLRHSIPSGYIMSGFNETNNQGFYISYTTLGSGQLEVKAQVSWPAQDDWVKFEIPPRTWTHLGIFWAATAAETSSLWVNGVKKVVTWTENPRTPTGNESEADVWWVLGGHATDVGVTGVSDVAFDEIYYREKWDPATVVQEYSK